MYPKHSMVEIILDYLQERAEDSADLFAMMTKSYQASYQHALRRRAGEPVPQFKKQWSDIYRRKMSFYSTLSQLRRDGLVEKKKSRGKIFWFITGKGKKKVSGRKSKFALSQLAKEAKKSPTLIIVSYDIPETHRHERLWLAEVLKMFGFTLVHKSVWVGEVRIPESLLREFEQREILDCLQMFEVGKRGTLKKVLG